MPVDFGKLENGDVLKAGNRPHFAKNKPHAPLYKKGEELIVTKKFGPAGNAGIKVKNRDGREAEYYFTDGAAKLEYTQDTVEAIRKRERFAREESAARAELSPEEMRRALQDLHEQLADQNEALKALTTGRQQPQSPGTGGPAKPPQAA